MYKDLGNYSPSVIRAVTGIVHSLVYDCAQTDSYNLSKPDDEHQTIAPEDDVSLYRISGAALCNMIKLRQDTLSQGKGKRQITPESRSKMETELSLLVQLKETDKSHLPEALKLLDEGNLTFVKKEFLDFVREADLNIREFVNERRLKKHKSNFLEVAHFNVYNDEELLKCFKWSLEKCGISSENISCNVHEINQLYSDMLHKFYVTQEQRSSSEENLKRTWPYQVKLLKLISLSETILKHSASLKRDRKVIRTM